MTVPPLREDGVVAVMTAEDFLSVLDREVPEVQQVVREHFEDDELLLHLLTADLRRFAIEAFTADRVDILQRLLNVINRALVEGTEDVENAVAVSFVEDTGWWDPAMQPFIKSWPSDLRNEALRQQEHRPT